MGSWRDQDRGARNFYFKERQANERLDKRDAALPPIGAIDPESGKLVVGYRSRAGRLGKYLLLSERQVVYQSEQISFVTLGFMGGKPMPDGKTGFDVRGDQIIRSEETDNAQGPVEDIDRRGNAPGPGGNPTPEGGNCGAA